MIACSVAVRSCYIAPPTYPAFLEILSGNVFRILVSVTDAYKDVVDDKANNQDANP